MGTSNEWDQIMAKNNVEAQLNEFYRFWAVKESVLKATGAGASAMRPSRIDIFTETEHPFDLGGDVHLDDTIFLIGRCFIFKLNGTRESEKKVKEREYQTRKFLFDRLLSVLFE